jgi:hypothetical protein
MILKKDFHGHRNFGDLTKECQSESRTNRGGFERIPKVLAHHLKPFQALEPANLSPGKLGEKPKKTYVFRGCAPPLHSGAYLHSHFNDLTASAFRHTDLIL